MSKGRELRGPVATTGIDMESILAAIANDGCIIGPGCHNRNQLAEYPVGIANERLVICHPAVVARVEVKNRMVSFVNTGPTLWEQVQGMVAGR